jgi:pimeloyl-ACP methyl ester carboxylesterase
MRHAAVLLLAFAAGARADPVEDLACRAAADRWSIRYEAVREMIALPKTDRFRLRRLLLEDPRSRVREAVALACALDATLGDASLLAIALARDSDPAVRRCAARALAHFRDRRAVAALVEALARERDPRTRLWIVDSLRALTPAPCLLDAGAWSRWWRENAADARFQPADEAARSGEYEGVELETRTVAPPPPSPGSNAPPFPHVLALPQFGWSTASFGPYLLPLCARAGISWVRLPGVQRLTGRSGFFADLPEYPVDRLVAALEAFRAALRVERVVVLAHGASGWIAMRYAQLHPRRCAALVLVDTALDAEAYVAALRRGAARGDAGERYLARTLLHENDAPRSPATLERLQAISLERGFSDPADLEIGDLFFRAREPQGFATVPDIRFAGRTRIETPSLFVYSAASPFSGHGDAERIAKHFPRSLVAPIAEARGMPFVEWNDAFFRVVEAFFERFPP